MQTQQQLSFSLCTSGTLNVLFCLPPGSRLVYAQKISSIIVYDTQDLDRLCPKNLPAHCLRDSGSRPVMPKNLPAHCLRHIGSRPIMLKNLPAHCLRDSGSRPVMPKNLPAHCLRHSGSQQVMSKKSPRSLFLALFSALFTGSAFFDVNTRYQSNGWLSI